MPAVSIVVGVRFLVIDQARGVQAEREGTFDPRLLRQQHALHIRVLDNGYATLDALTGISRRFLQRAL